MYELFVNDKRTTIVLEFKAHVNEGEVQTLRSEIEKIVPTLQSGFQLLVNLTDLATMNKSVRTEMGRMMDFLNERGIKKVVRIIPDRDKDIGLNILSAFHYSPAVKVFTVRTHAEALKHFGWSRVSGMPD